MAKRVKKINKIVLDDCYSLECSSDCVTLKYSYVTEQFNEKTGKMVTSSERWYYPTISLALKKFLQESAADNTGVMQILKRIDDVEKLIDSKF